MRVLREKFMLSLQAGLAKTLRSVMLTFECHFLIFKLDIVKFLWNKIFFYQALHEKYLLHWLELLFHHLFL
jgi:hypothetical protein